MNPILKISSTFCFVTLALTIAITSCKKSDSDPVKEVVLPEFAVGKPSYPTEVTSNSAKVVSEVNGTAGECMEQYGVFWSTTNKLPTAADNKTELGKYCGPFPVSFENQIKPLVVGTVYYVRPYAINAGGTSYGAVQEIRPGGTPPQFPKAFGLPVISYNEITCTAYIESNGGSPIVQHGFVYTTEIFVGAFITGKSVQLGAYTGAFPGAFSGKITGLKPETAYTIRPYAINASGVSYGQALLLTTLKQP